MQFHLVTRLAALTATIVTLNLRAAEAGPAPATPSAADSPREHLSLDAGWKFHLGDDWPNALRLDKAGSSGGPASEKFNDNSWRSLDLPHDWAIELPFDRTSDESHGFKPVGPGFYKNSIGWYRRTFELPAADSGKRIWLTFDGQPGLRDGQSNPGFDAGIEPRRHDVPVLDARSQSRHAGRAGRAAGRWPDRRGRDAGTVQEQSSVRRIR